MQRMTWGALIGLAGLVACGSDDEATGSSTTSGAGGAGTSSSSSQGVGGDATTSTGGQTGSGGDTGNGGSGGSAPIVCDYQVDNGVMVIEAEDLPLSADWQTASAEAGFTGAGYIVWTGNSQNNNPGQGTISVDVYVPVAGRYRWRWRNRIGMGTNTTEHNDTWLRWPTLPATGYYGMRNPGNESRRFPRPTCEDANLMQMVEQDPDVTSAGCPNGSSSDGWMKIYSSGANDWRWSTRTSDNDAHDIFIEVDAPGVVTFEMSARADFHLIDRIVLSEESVADNVAEDTAASPTPCD